MPMAAGAYVRRVYGEEGGPLPTRIGLRFALAGEQLFAAGPCEAQHQ